MLGLAARYANDAIIVVDGGGCLAEVNDRFCQMYGYAPAEAAGLSLVELRAPETLTTLDADLRCADEHGALTFQTIHRRKDGTCFPVEVSTRVALIEGDAVKISVIRDIAERKAAEARIGRLSRLYQAIAAAQQAMLHSTTEDEVFGRICAVATDYGLRMAWVGMAEGDQVRPVKWSGAGSDYLDGLVITLDPADPRSWGPTGTAVRTGRHVICNDFQHDLATQPWHERGRTFGWGASGAFPLLRGGRPVGALTIYSSEPGFFGEDELALLDDLAANISFLLDRFQVEERKNELEAALKASLDHMVDVNLELERFSEIYSHHLQEPVRNVVAYAQLLERRLAGKLDADQSALLAILAEGARRIGQLNLDLLAFAQARHADSALGEADCDRALRYAREQLASTIEQAGAVIEAKPLPRVLGAEPELRQVFVNLLSNALKFAAPDRRPVIRIGAVAEQGGWHFTVADNGIGIAPEYLDKVFGVFVRLHTSQAYPGSGVGLAITRRSIERQGGRVWIDSQPDCGTVVHFWLRAAEAGP